MFGFRIIEQASHALGTFLLNHVSWLIGAQRFCMLDIPGARAAVYQAFAATSWRVKQHMDSVSHAGGALELGRPCHKSVRT